MSPPGDKPFRACGCIYADSERNMRAVVELLRAMESTASGSVKMGGFSVESVVTNEDGSVTTRVLP